MNDSVNEIPLANSVPEKKKEQISLHFLDRAFIMAVCTFSLFGGALCMGSMVVYSRLAPPLLDAMYPTISELTMREAESLESAQDYAAAFDTYLKALEGRFQGQQNRALTLYRLGMLQREHALGKDKPDFLKQAYEHPRCPVATFDVLARESLSAYGPDKESMLKELFARWEGAAKSPEEWAMLYFFKGGHAQLQGRLELARTYWAHGEGYSSGSPCAYALGEALYTQGAYALSEYYNNKYLLEGQNPDYLASAQALSIKLALTHNSSVMSTQK